MVGMKGHGGGYAGYAARVDPRFTGGQEPAVSRPNRFCSRARVLALTFFLLGTLVIWLLVPLGSPRYRIEFDPAEVAYRESFLGQGLLEPAADAPNVVLILADDLGRYEVSRYGGRHVPTPHIDAIGESGVTFSEGYITSPICSPSRAGLITGRYPQRFGFEINVHERYPKNRLELYAYRYLVVTGDWLVADRGEVSVPSFDDMHKQGLPPTEFTLPEVLTRVGYRSGIMGKWHLGYGDSSLPLRRGFDTHYGFYEAFSLYAPVDDPSIVNRRLDHFADRHIWKKGRSGNCAIRRDHRVIDETDYLTPRIAQETNAWIAENQDHRFFAYVPFSAPHTPFQVPREYSDRFADAPSPEKQVYWGMIAALDDAVGAILGQLETLGLREKTLVFFLSDNGGATYTGAADNSPLKGGKLTNFEGGIRVPFMVSWPGHLPAGRWVDGPVTSLDIFATVAAATGAPVPPERPLDGVDLLRYFSADSAVAELPARDLYWRSGDHRAVRSGRWKMVDDRKSRRRVLYDVLADESENQDLSAVKPEVVKDLLGRFEAWETEMIDPRWPRVMDYRIVDGTAEYYFPL